MLLAWSSLAHARDTSQINQKIPAIVLVSIIDGAAFTEADADSLKRFTKKVLPNHEFIHINVNAPIEYASRPSPGYIDQIQLVLASQIRKQIKSDHQITHFVLMDHGNIDQQKTTSTIFKYLSQFDQNGVSRDFNKIFSPLIGKFSNDAMVMMESCITVCDGPDLSRARIQKLMNYFKIPNGRIFGAYQNMVSVGYETGFHVQQILGRMISIPFLTSAIAIGLMTQADSFAKGTPYDFTQAIIGTLAADVGLPILMKGFALLKQRLKAVNWSYLYQLHNGTITKIYELNPYQNTKELYLQLIPKRFKSEQLTCASVFM